MRPVFKTTMTPTGRDNVGHWRFFPNSEKVASARQLVRQDGWQASIFGGRNRPSLLMVAHQLASTSEVTSS